MDDARDRGRPRLILIELNEINFDVAGSYVSPTKLPGFRKLLSWSSIHTTAEVQYESLEPWIQWPSVHSGLTASEHNIFRLGDITKSKIPQMFEQLEGKRLRIGAISAMNAENRLANPAYFIPDPWTKTPSDNSWWSTVLTAAVSQAVNDNSKSVLTARSAAHLALALARFAQPKHYGMYLRLLAGSRGAPWRKALLLDLLLHDIHIRLFRKQQPDFSTLFLNAGAHIQHHYFFNARTLRDKLTMRNPSWYIEDGVDPIGELMDVYDLILRDYQEIPGVDVIVATGLSQRPYDRVKFYYRLNAHAEFLRTAGITFKDVLPRMTRDFLIEFADAAEAEAAQRRLASITIDGDTRMFGDIDNRGSSLFVTLTYPQEITATTTFTIDGKSSPLAPHVTFVAIKNGMHQQKGFAFFTPNLTRFAPREGDHVKELYGTIMRFFDAGASQPAG